MEYSTDYRDYYKNQSYYDVLGVKEDASLERIQRAKDDLKFGEPDDRAPFSMWAKIDEAYSVLSDREKRREYDRKLAESRSAKIGHEANSDDVVEEISKQIEKQYSSTINEPKMKSETVISKPSEEKTTSENADKVEENPSEEKEYDLNYVSPFNPKEKETKSKIEESKAKTVAKYVGGTLTGFLVAGPIGAVAVPIWMKKHKKVSLQKGDKPKKITKISTSETAEIEKYNQTLNAEINRLLSEPHNNYKLEINKAKYENQIALLEKLLDIKLSKKVKKIEILKHKLDVASTKMQLETAKKNLANIQEKITEYEKEQGLSKVNKQLIEVNQQLAEKKGDKSFSIRKLEAYQTKLLNKRDSKAKRVKFLVEKSSKVYDGFLKAKDFVVSIPYMFKSSEKMDEFLSDELQKTR